MDTALYKGKKINIMDYENPKLELEKKSLLCQFCMHNLFIKNGEIRTKHFSHYPGHACDFENKQGEPESVTHRHLKRYVAKILNGDDVDVLMEESILGGKRIADILVETHRGHKTVYECQCSRVTIGSIKERTEDYWKAGMDVVWVMLADILSHDMVKKFHDFDIPCWKAEIDNNE